MTKKTMDEAVQEYCMSLMSDDLKKNMNRAWWSLQFGPFGAEDFAEEDGCDVGDLKPPYPGYTEVVRQLEKWFDRTLFIGVLYDRVSGEVLCGLLRPCDNQEDEYVRVEGQDLALIVFGDIYRYGGMAPR